jgi:hypothetical protein
MLDANTDVDANADNDAPASGFPVMHRELFPALAALSFAEVSSAKASTMGCLPTPPVDAGFSPPSAEEGITEASASA